MLHRGHLVCTPGKLVGWFPGLDHDRTFVSLSSELPFSFLPGFAAPLCALGSPLCGSENATERKCCFFPKYMEMVLLSIQLNNHYSRSLRLLLLCLQMMMCSLGLMLLHYPVCDVIMRCQVHTTRSSMCICLWAIQVQSSQSIQCFTPSASFGSLWSLYYAYYVIVWVGWFDEACSPGGPCVPSFAA